MGWGWGGGCSEANGTDKQWDAFEIQGTKTKGTNFNSTPARTHVLKPEISGISLSST